MSVMKNQEKMSPKEHRKPLVTDPKKWRDMSNLTENSQVSTVLRNLMIQENNTRTK